MPPPDYSVKLIVILAALGVIIVLLGRIVDSLRILAGG